MGQSLSPRRKGFNITIEWISIVSTGILRFYLKGHHGTSRKRKGTWIILIPWGNSSKGNSITLFFRSYI